jgi:hypothetical protein
MSQQTFDTTTANAVLKELYDGQLPELMIYQDRPTLAMLTKMKNFGGRNYPIPVQYGVNQGRSSDFATSQANATANQFVEFLLTRAKDYAVGYISNELLLAASNDRESFVRSATNIVDGTIQSATASLASAIFRSGTGTIGQITSITTGVIVLADKSQVTQFEKNMTLQANATDGGTPRAAVGYVIGRNAAAGTITVSASFGGAAGTPASWAASDFLLVQGDNNVKLKGLAAWCPAVAPTAGDNFYSVDRSSDSRLYGLYQDLSSESIEEALTDMSMLLSQEGATTDTAIVNFNSFSALEKSLGSKVQYTDMTKGEINFRGIQVNGSKKTIKVFPDKDCQAQTAWVLQMNTWTLATLGDAPMILRYGSGDNAEMLRVYNADQAEVRVGYYGALGCSAPGWNGQVKLGA